VSACWKRTGVVVQRSACMPATHVSSLPSTSPLRLNGGAVLQGMEAGFTAGIVNQMGVTTTAALVQRFEGPLTGSLVQVRRVHVCVGGGSKEAVSWGSGCLPCLSSQVTRSTDTEAFMHATAAAPAACLCSTLDQVCVRALVCLSLHELSTQTLCRRCLVSCAARPDGQHRALPWQRPDRCVLQLTVLQG
jgi:hypothetical protein